MGNYTLSPPILSRAAKMPLFVVALLLGGCMPSQWSPVVEAVVKEKKAQADAEAALVVRAPCIMGVGAYMRLEAKSDRDAVALLCGGNGDFKPAQ